MGQKKARMQQLNARIDQIVEEIGELKQRSSVDCIEQEKYCQLHTVIIGAGEYKREIEATLKVLESILTGVLSVEQLQLHLCFQGLDVDKDMLQMNQFIQILERNTQTALQELKLVLEYPHDNNEMIRRLARSLFSKKRPPLRRLELDACTLKFLPELFQEARKLQPTLKEVAITRFQLQRQVFATASNLLLAFPFLSTLVLDGCFGEADDLSLLAHAFNKDPQVNRMRYQIREFRFRENGWLSIDVLIETVLSACPNLEVLDLSSPRLIKRRGQPAPESESAGHEAPGHEAPGSVAPPEVRYFKLLSTGLKHSLSYYFYLNLRSFILRNLQLNVDSTNKHDLFKFVRHLLHAAGQNLRELDFSQSWMNWMFFEEVGNAFAQELPSVQSLESIALDGWQLNGMMADVYRKFFGAVCQIRSLRTLKLNNMRCIRVSSLTQVTELIALVSKHAKSIERLECDNLNPFLWSKIQGNQRSQTIIDFKQLYQHLLALKRLKALKIDNLLGFTYGLTGQFDQLVKNTPDNDLPCLEELAINVQLNRGDKPSRCVE